MKSSWDDVILDEDKKKDLTAVANKFFSSKAIYEDLGVPWKRGLMFYGPPGNGKTISIRALMHELYTRKDKDGNHKPVPTLYVKSAPSTYSIGAVFAHARRYA
jgi:DNA polymerase III delta prime subunit